ncbi:hypothetical protein QFC19_002585 [Naganishia cerealis]|uniref:Uncharacterized protein n=1 Tax=Naganishia cerealis TaxID=610337 RepID=A0ACC2WAA1_9TREE|nr:hypothetical protein QFC19_002585 [Naganishia cerealis]
MSVLFLAIPTESTSKSSFSDKGGRHSSYNPQDTLSVNTGERSSMWIPSGASTLPPEVISLIQELVELISNHFSLAGKSTTAETLEPVPSVVDAVPPASELRPPTDRMSTTTSDAIPSPPVDPTAAQQRALATSIPVGEMEQVEESNPELEGLFDDGIEESERQLTTTATR